MHAEMLTVLSSWCVLIALFEFLRPYSSVLGQAKDTELYRNRENFEKVSVF